MLSATLYAYATLLNVNNCANTQFQIVNHDGKLKLFYHPNAIDAIEDSMDNAKLRIALRTVVE